MLLNIIIINKNIIPSKIFSSFYFIPPLYFIHFTEIKIIFFRVYCKKFTNQEEILTQNEFFKILAICSKRILQFLSLPSKKKESGNLIVSQANHFKYQEKIINKKTLKNMYDNCVLYMMVVANHYIWKELHSNKLFKNK